MAGLLILIILVIWFYLVLFLVKKITSKIKNPFVKFIVTLVLVVFIYPLPYLDEFIASYQFEKICAEDSVPWLSKEVEGKTIYLQDNGVELVSNVWVKIVKKPWNYVDVKTKEIIISYNVYSAGGGVITKTFLSPISNGPFIFYGFCGPVFQPDSDEYFKSLGVNYIQRSDIKNWEIKNHENE